MNDRMPGPADPRGISALERIADALELPVQDLLTPAPDTESLSAQAHALLTTFLSIADPRRRQACLDYVRGIADEACPLDRTA